MKKILMFLMISMPLLTYSQNIDSLLKEVATVDHKEGNVWDILYDSTYMVVQVDSPRVSVTAFVSELKGVSKKEMISMLKSHSFNSFDVRYAIFNNRVWVIFDSPLKAIYDGYLKEAIRQVKSLAESFRGDYSSTEIIYVSN